jgi:hypothetical protein
MLFLDTDEIDVPSEPDNMKNMLLNLRKKISG